MDTRKIPLQQIASEYLGVEYKEIKPILTYKKNKRINTKSNKVTFAIHSTSQAKYWNNPNGWEELAEYFNSKGIKPTLISKEKNGYMGNQHPSQDLIIDKSGEYPIKDRINDILDSKLFIGISSGLSWLAWALNVPTIIISGFTDPWYEPAGVYRIHNSNVCHGCWHKYVFDKGDWNWCPVYKGTDKQFECTKKISSQQVIDVIEKENLCSKT